MSMNRLTLTLSAAAMLALPLAGRAQMHDHSAMMKEAAKVAPAATAPRTVDMTLSDDGVSPSEVKATKGEPLRLAITRKTSSTCITGMVVQDYGINQPLPLNKTVLVDITPKASGKVRFLCPMGMNFATMVVQ
jgi:plastocyanin domain-containing protein